MRRGEITRSLPHPTSHYESWYVAGQHCCIDFNEIRAPLCILHKIAESWEIPVISHRNTDGTYWYSLKTTRREAVTLFRRLKSMYPNGKSTVEYVVHRSGGRASL